MYFNKIAHLILSAIYFVFSYHCLFATEEKISENENKNKIFIIRNIDGDSSDKLSVITIRLNHMISGEIPKITSHDGFLQFILRNTIIKNPGEFVELKGPILKKIVAVQADEKDTLIRIFTKKNSFEVMEASEIDFLNKRIVFSVDHNRFYSHVDKDNSKFINTDKDFSKEDVINNNSLKSDMPSDIDKMESNNNLSSDHSSFREYLENLAWMFFGLILTGLAMLSLRRVFRNRKLMKYSSVSVPMRTLNDLVLAPRQKLSLVQVGAEQLLLSVSPDGISLISHMDEFKNKMTEKKLDKFSSKSDQIFGPVISGKKFNVESDLLRKSLTEEKSFSENSSKFDIETTRKNNRISSNKKYNHSVQRSFDSQKKRQPGKSVEFRVDDNGISNTKKIDKKAMLSKNSTENAIEDVTQLIREKLKSLPKL